MAAAAPPAVPGRGPTTYGLHYKNLHNVLQGGYGPLYHRHDITNNTDGAVLLRQVLLASQAIPKVYLCLVQNANNRLEIIAPHRPTPYALDTIRTTPWDDRNFAFLGDVRPGNYIKMIEFPDNAFDITGAQQVPTLDNTTSVLAANLAINVLREMAANAADSEEV
jgi:hypothetical protein